MKCVNHSVLFSVLIMCTFSLVGSEKLKSAQIKEHDENAWVVVGEEALVSSAGAAVACRPRNAMGVLKETPADILKQADAVLAGYDEPIDISGVQKQAEIFLQKMPAIFDIVVQSEAVKALQKALTEYGQGVAAEAQKAAVKPLANAKFSLKVAVASLESNERILKELKEQRELAQKQKFKVDPKKADKQKRRGSF